MRRVRIIPSLLIQNGGLVKSVRFKNHVYVGDPVNTVRIFNDKEVDEIVILDISTSRKKEGPNIDLVSQIASECFMPMAYGGGIKNLDEIKKLVSAGVEKVIINAMAVANPLLISEAAQYLGSQSVVVSIDVRKNFWGAAKVYTEGGRTNTNIHPLKFARQMEELGAGEILLTSIEREGTFSGFDLDLIKAVSSSLTIPVVAHGGASSVDDFRNAINNGASAVAAGSMFVFQGPHRAVLVGYPTQKELNEKVFSQLG